MNAWEWGRIALIAGIALLIASLGIGCWGIWTSDSRGEVAVLPGFAAAVSTFAGFGVMDLNKPPAKRTRLNRADRKRLREEESRIEMYRRIKELEKEAGL